ncbi:HupE/UreJ family protein [Photobacterium minamisatsumaniensis]|uniref:HupE/UreJ family protein n=1 Tax=Photobacterium minamisatsumaniensis TaxID=2910233 RepID=UPI003D0B8B5E
MNILFRSAIRLLLPLLTLFATPASSHGLEPIFISVITMENNQYRVELRLPDEYKEENSPYFILPDTCKSHEFNHLISTISCQETLTGAELEIRYDYYVPQISTLINYYDKDGNNELTEIDGQLSWTVPEEVNNTEKNKLFLIVGFEHILGGFDHILFIVCLLIIVQSKKKLIQTITGFTIAHSITLLLVSTGVIKPAIEPIELIVAMSVLLLAYEIATNENSLTHRYPITISIFCGLLHGIGFSSVLSGVNTTDLINLSSILFFNLGIELGQLLIVSLWLTMAFIAKKLSFDKSEMFKAKIISVYLTGGLSLFWVLDRLFIWLNARAIHLFV